MIKVTQFLQNGDFEIFGPNLGLNLAQKYFFGWKMEVQLTIVHYVSHSKINMLL